MADMPSITQAMRNRESLLKYEYKWGVKRAGRKYNEHRSFIYFWKQRWEESGRNIEALRGKSKRPLSHPNQHTEAELTLIRNMRRRSPNIGLMDLWYKLQVKAIQGVRKGSLSLYIGST
jgi:transposase